MPKVSVILPVYNGAEHVSNSIDSVLAQTFSDFEFIIVNDCSTDNTWDILKSYALRDERIRIFSNDVNLKLPRTLNEGFSHATGEYLTWTSDDNLYKPNALQEMVKYLDTNPDCGLVYADMTVVNELGEEITERIQVAENPKELATHSICGACFMYRKQIADKIGVYDPDLFLAEDYEYWIRISEASSIMPLHKNLYTYRLQPNSLSGSIRWERIKAQKVKVINKHFDYLLSLCENQDDRIRFFDNYLKCSDKANRSEHLHKVCTIMPEYSRIDKKNRINYCKYKVKSLLGIVK